MYLFSIHFIATIFCTSLSLIIEPDSRGEIVAYFYTFDGLYAFYLGIVCGFIGNGAFYYLLQHVNPLILSVIINFDPITGTLFVWLFNFQKVITLSTILGGLIVIIGNTIVTVSTSLKKNEIKLIEDDIPE